MESSEVLLEWAVMENKRGMDVTDKLLMAVDVLLEVEKEEEAEESASMSSFHSTLRRDKSMA